MPSSLAQEMMTDDSGRTAAYRRMRSDEDEDVKVGSPLRKGRPVYPIHLEFHWRTQQGPLDESIR